jgi:hypothetical protein
MRFCFTILELTDRLKAFFFGGGGGWEKGEEKIERG